MPDAVGFALRSTIALLLAYYVSFAIQLDSASSAGLCVAIVAQPTPGMTTSKAVYRTAGTILGGVVSLLLVAAFGQDRTMLLISFTFWLAACTFVAALLRDFRSYGAVLCGYTVGIIAISGIDAPSGAFIATLDRVAAILIGIGAVALVNLFIAAPMAYRDLVHQLRDRLAAGEALARAALEGRGLPEQPAPALQGAAILALRTEAAYAAAELPNGRARRSGAEAAIAGLLGMLSATRAIGTGMTLPTSDATRQALLDACATLGGPVPPPPTALPAEPHDASLLDRSRELLLQHAVARDGLYRLEHGEGPTEQVRLPFHRDYIGALLSAMRTLIAVGLGSVFCVYSGVSSTTALLVQQAAFTALLGMAPNPSAAGVGMAIALVPAAIAAGFINFYLLPQASGFVPFALAIGGVFFAMGLAARHPKTARLGPGLMLYFTLLLAPSNTESFDLSAYLNGVLIQMTAAWFMLLAFRLVLPVSPRRRLGRVVHAMVQEVRAARDGKPARWNAVAARSLRFDRLAQAQVWLSGATPGRQAVLKRLSAFAEMESTLRRANAGMSKLGRKMPARDPDTLEAAAKDILAGEYSATVLPWALHAAAGLYGAAVMLRRHGRALRHYSVLRV